MALLPNAVVEDRYVVVRSLKTGGMGAIYEAVDKRLGETPCALKELLTRDADEDQLLVLRKFEEEMRILASLNHPGIPRVRDYFMHDGTRYIVMDLVDGQNLEELLLDSITLRGRPLLPTQVVAYGVQILDVLHYLHSHFPPIIHRDLKPANAILEKSSQKVKVVDFGLARAIKSTKSSQTAIASLGYAPLEQIQGRATVRSDIYALGATMFHLLTGSVPVPMDAGPIQESNVEIDDELARIIDKATAVDEAERFQSAGLMLEALLAWQEGRSTGLPRRRPRRKTQNRVTRKALPQPRPITSELLVTESSDDPATHAEAAVASPTVHTTIIARPRVPWQRWLTMVLSIVLVSAGVWMVQRSIARLGSKAMGDLDHPTDVLASPMDIQRMGLHLTVPAGWRVLENRGTMDGSHSHILLGYKEARLQIDLGSVSTLPSLADVRKSLETELKTHVVGPVNPRDRAWRFSFDNGREFGDVIVLRDTDHRLADGDLLAVTVRETVPKAEKLLKNNLEDIYKNRMTLDY